MTTTEPIRTRCRIAPRIVRVVLLGERSPAAGRPPSPRVRGRRARAAVAFGVVLFLAAQAGLNVAISREWVPIRDPIFAEKTEILRPHRGFFAAGPTDNPVSPVHVAALGTSRTQLAFDAGRFAESVTATTGRRTVAFNFGVPAGGPLTSAIYLRRLLADGFAPDVLFVEVHPCFVAPHDPPFETRWLHGFRLRPEEIPVLRGFGWAVESPPHHGWRGWAAAAYSYRLGLLNHYSPVLLPCPYGLNAGAKTDEFGYVAGIDLTPSLKKRALERTREQYLPVLDNYAVGGAGVAALRDVLTVCRDRGIRTAIVLTPESSEFRGWYGAGYAKIGEFADEIGCEFGSPVFDGREWVPDADIADGHHLTDAGAKTFTDRLAARSSQWLVASGQTKHGGAKK